MESHPIYARTDLLEERLIELLDFPPYDTTERLTTSWSFCDIAWQHWQGVRGLSENNLQVSASALLRVQFETLVRALWCFYCASDQQIEKLNRAISSESEQAAKNLPLTAEMLERIKSTPNATNAWIRLDEFKRHSWKPLNSYVHAGLHPLQRHETGYPPPLIEQTIRASNALAMMGAMQLAILTGINGLHNAVMQLSHNHLDCLPPMAAPENAPDPTVQG
jgi:hypothetical protein